MKKWTEKKSLVKSTELKRQASKRKKNKAIPRSKRPLKKAVRSLRLQIQNQSAHRVSALAIKKWVADVVPRIQQRTDRWPEENRDLTLVLLDEDEARKLNQQFRKKNYATDILSFAPTDTDSLGELVISCDVVQRQAVEHGHSFQAELGYLLIHGILHLLGYEHENGGRAAAEMYRLQDEIFDQMMEEMRA